MNQADLVVDHAALEQLKTDIGNAKTTLGDMADISVSERTIGHKAVKDAVSNFVFGVKSHKTRILKGVEGMDTALGNALKATTDADNQMSQAIQESGSDK